MIIDNIKSRANYLHSSHPRYGLEWFRSHSGRVRSSEGMHASRTASTRASVSAFVVARSACNSSSSARRRWPAPPRARRIVAYFLPTARKPILALSRLTHEFKSVRPAGSWSDARPGPYRPPPPARRRPPRAPSPAPRGCAPAPPPPPRWRCASARALPPRTRPRSAGAAAPASSRPPPRSCEIGKYREHDPTRAAPSSEASRQS